VGLRVTQLELRDWRSFEDRQVDFSDGVTVLVGPNAVGKTNTIEALQLLTAGFSFRRPKASQLVRQGGTQGRAQARLVGDGRLMDVACEAGERRRRFFVNGKPVRSLDMPRNLMSVLFNPDDLAFVKASAHVRRDELDDFGRQASVGYGNLLASYQRTVEQRNRLLKDVELDRSLLDAWDVSLAAGAAALMEARAKLFGRLTSKMVPIFEEISGGERLDCAYVSRLGDLSSLGRSELEDRFYQAICDAREEDIRRQMTCVGPHRDDLSFIISDKDARVFGSQGQQRTVVLAWKLAEVEVACDVSGSRPLLLLDDVMSELDADRRAAVTRFVQQGIQTVITTTNIGYFSDLSLKDAKVVRYEDQ
jgi:DNA replication and repair protein RecF